MSSEEKEKKLRRRRRGLYLAEVPMREEVRTVAQRTGIPEDAVIGILLAPCEGRVAELVARHVAYQLGQLTLPVVVDAANEP